MKTQDIIKIVEQPFLEHPWLVTALVVFLGSAYLIGLLLKNNALTSAMAKKMNDEDTNSLVKEIRSDQLKSNRIRESMNDNISEMSEHITEVDESITILTGRVDTFSLKGKDMKKQVDALMEYHIRHDPDGELLKIIKEYEQLDFGDKLNENI